MTFAARLWQAVDRKGTPAMLGLDPRPDHFPEPFRARAGGSAPEAAAATRAYHRALLDVAAPRVAAVKPQAAFFEQLGPPGWDALADAVSYAKELGLVVVLDAKRGDIGSTSEAYAQALLGGGWAGGFPAADALTVNPYLGEDACRPFVDAARAADAGLFVLVKTSNPGAATFQEHGDPPLADTVAAQVARWGEEWHDADGWSPVGAVVGATRPDELAHFRALMPRAPLLLPGFGHQGGGAEGLDPAFDENGHGAVVNASRPTSVPDRARLVAPHGCGHCRARAPRRRYASPEPTIGEESMGALDGIRVIDFGQYIAGPMTGMLLADQGAEVIKVDPPGGPTWDAPANATWNRGKQSIVLDLKSEADRDAARRLIASADVVVENFRPGVMDRLGLGAVEMTETDPRLIYASLPGFASDDPRREMRAWEGVVGAATATYFARGVFQMEDSPRPVYTAVPIPSSYAAFQAATAIGMALVARDRDGRGQRIEVPLFDGMFGALGYRGQHPFSIRGLSGLRTTQYECADGRWVQFHSGNQNVPEFMELAGISHWTGEGLFEPERREELDQKFIALFKTRTAQEWEDLIAEAGSEATVCRTSAEWLTHEHARASRMIVDVAGPAARADVPAGAQRADVGNARRDPPAPPARRRPRRGARHPRGHLARRADGARAARRPRWRAECSTSASCSPGRRRDERSPSTGRT